MSFTEDELQAFNKILDQRLSAHRRDMERVFDQRMNALRRDIEQRLTTAQQELLRTMTQKLTDHHQQLNAGLNQKLSSQQTRFGEIVSENLEQTQQQQQQQFEGLIESTLAAQLLAIEQLINQWLALQPISDPQMHVSEYPPHFETIEVQTELPWEDLMDVFGKSLDERFVVLHESIQMSIKSWEQYLSRHLQALYTQLRDELSRKQSQFHNGTEAMMSATHLQEALQGIEQLEHIIEAMQVAMTNNHALLSNRLYHHQSLPLERAHPGSQPQPTPPNGFSSPIGRPEEREGQ